MLCLYEYEHLELGTINKNSTKMSKKKRKEVVQQRKPKDWKYK